MSVTLEDVSIDDITEYVVALGGVLTLRPHPGDGSPQISWGDAFFYFAPDGVIPRSQPFATVVTKDYPDDDRSQLSRPGVFRLNISASASTYRDVIGWAPREVVADDTDPSTPDVLIPHPVYGRLGWLAVVNPADHTAATVRNLLTSAHAAARDRYRRRAEAGR